MRALVRIEPYEVRQVLDATDRWPRPGIGTAGVSVLTIWGRTRTGRPLIVALHHAGGFTWRIVGARDMTDNEQAEFAGWEETR
jgi:hypothetical protein